MLKKAWESGQLQDTSVIVYIIQIREQLQMTMGLIQQNMAKAQADQKRW